MDDHVRRAEQLAEVVRLRFEAEGLRFFHCLDSREHLCMVHVDFFDEDAGEHGDGLTFTVIAQDSWIEVLDPNDYHLHEPELPEYLIMRARGATPRQAFAAIDGARPKRSRWWHRLTRHRSNSSVM